MSKTKFIPDFSLALKNITTIYLKPTQEELQSYWSELPPFRKNYMNQELFEKHAKYRIILKDDESTAPYLHKNIKGADRVGVSYAI
jgi:hypothetical protein